CAAIEKLKQSQTFLISDGDHCSQRCIDSLRKNRCARLRVRRGIAKNFRKGFSETALRFKTAAIACLIYAAALPHLAQGETHPARAMISLKRHPVVAFELTSRGRGIDRQPRQFLVSEASARGAFDFDSEAFDQFGRTLIRIHWMAAQAGTITAFQCFTRSRGEIDILTRRLFRRAGRTAE